MHYNIILTYNPPSRG